jgi:hypothetical protein
MGWVFTSVIPYVSAKPNGKAIISSRFTIVQGPNFPFYTSIMQAREKVTLLRNYFYGGQWRTCAFTQFTQP